jgi:putative porin
MNTTRSSRLRLGAGLAALALAAGFAVAGGPAFAQEAVAQASPPSDSAMVNLIRMLVAKGTLTPEDGAKLMQDAQAEADRARSGQATQMAALAAPSAGTVRVPYVPQVVRDQIKEEVKQEVLAQAKTEGWISSDILPDWVRRVEWTGDFRFRDEFDLFSGDNTDEYVDYAAFNSSGPVDINPVTNPNGIPLLNTRRDRNNILRLRARLGLKAQINDHVDFGLRLATGSDNGPVSTNQTLGGGLSKKAIWLDQAYVNLKPVDGAVLTLGRMPNPFLSTDLLYDDDLNFDGAAASYALNGGGDGWSLRATAGAFPIEYGGNNFPTNDFNKAGTDIKWLYGAQVEGGWRSDNLNVRVAAAYYDFDGVQGQLSEPCGLFNGNKQCSTDQSRPAFMQKGNSLFLIRNIVPDPSRPLNFPQAQFVGLVMDYDVLNLTAQIDWKVSGDHHLLLQGDIVLNLAYDADEVCKSYPLGLPVNNIQAGEDAAGNPVNVDPCGAPPAGIGRAEFKSGGLGWAVRGTFGNPRPRAWGQWNISAGYKYIEPDAVVDAFTDSDFHLGGTNAKGYYVAANIGLYRNTWLTARWLSANEVYGPPLSIDVGQIDLNIGF